jgi:chromatin remodeling complex protein RSC6
VSKARADGGESIFPRFDLDNPIPGHRSNALQQPLIPSPQLAAVIGAGQITRGDVVSKIWVYIKQNNLQNPANKREILADARLKPVLDGKAKVSMFEMSKHLAKHLK